MQRGTAPPPAAFCAAVPQKMQVKNQLKWVSCGSMSVLAPPQARRSHSRRVGRELSRLRPEHRLKQPQRRTRIGALLRPATDGEVRKERAFYFDLIKDYPDAVYNHVRRELTCGTAPEGHSLISSTPPFSRRLDKFKTKAAGRE
jgi:hypothetical protein